MDQEHRETIDRACDEISPIVDMSTLWPRLIEYGVYSEDDVIPPAWKNNLTHLDTVRDILLTIKTRGPTAFTSLIRALSLTGQSSVVNILLREMEPPLIGYTLEDENLESGDEISTISWETEINNNFNISTQPMRIQVKTAIKFLDEGDYSTLPRYRMRSQPRGYVLIITIISYLNVPLRESAIHDKNNLETLFRDMGFEVMTTDDNLTGAEIKETVKQFALKNFHNIDSCFVIISAHGEEIKRNGLPVTEIHGSDYNGPDAEKVFTSDLIKFFASDHCNGHLIGKPKVFIFQACRGNKNEMILPRHETDGRNPNELPRKFSDILVAYSTLSGHVAYRDKYIGSWYIQILCSVFMRYAYKMHLVDLFSQVDGVLKHMRTCDNDSQTSEIQLIGFHQHCYLNPGLFERS